MANPRALKAKGDAVASIRKAVFPLAGLSPRFLPASKASPKEMLSVVDKPLIQYAVAAGVEKLIFVTGRGKHTIEDHFDQAFELEHPLQRGGCKALLQQVRGILPRGFSCIFMR
jgi:UTP--glucose-1-phosphate uridylyltransferase